MKSDGVKGFTATNLKYMRQFFAAFPKSHALRGELSWTHYRLLLKVEKPDARAWYETEAATQNWSTREPERQINSLFWERAALSRGIMDTTNKTLAFFWYSGKQSNHKTRKGENQKTI